MNFQDVLREVYDGNQKALKTTASLSAATVYVGNPTLYAVVNTAAAGDSVNNIGFATVSVSNPTLYAVVNTSASSGFATIDVRNTVDVTSNSGVTVYQGGTFTVTQASSARTITGNLTLSDSKTFIGLVSVGGGVLNTVTAVTDITNPVALKGNLTLSDSKAYVGLVTATVGNTITVNAHGITGNLTLSDPKGFIGLVSVGGGVLNTVAAVTDITNPVAIKGNLTLSDSKGYIGLVTANIVGTVNTGMTTLFPGPNYIGLVTADIGTIKAWTNPNTFIGLTTSTIGNTINANVSLSNSLAHIGSVSIFGSITANTGMTTLFPGPNYIGLATVDIGTIKAWNNPNTFIGLVTASIGNNPVLGSGVNSVGFATVAVSTPTLFAVVNTGAPGTTDITSDSGVTVYQGGTWTVTQASSARTITGNLTLSDSKGFIGLVTVGGGTIGTTFAGNVTLDPGSKTGIVGNVTLSDSKTFIGLTTVNIGSSNTVVLGSGVGNVGFASVTPVSAWPNPNTFIGLVTVGNTVTVTQSSAARTITGNLTLSDAKTYIGLTTATLGVSDRFVGLVTVVQSSSARTITGNLTLSDAKTYLGLTTTTLGVGTTFIGLVTSWSRNAGTTKTLVPQTIGISTTSLTTIFVPTNTFKVTQLLLSSDATVKIAIKSGVTYLTGNASLGISLNPGGGWVENGSPDSPVYVGLAGAAAFVVEKNNITANIGGKVIYFDE